MLAHTPTYPLFQGECFPPFHHTLDSLATQRKFQRLMGFNCVHTWAYTHARVASKREKLDGGSSKLEKQRQTTVLWEKNGVKTQLLRERAK